MTRRSHGTTTTVLRCAATPCLQWSSRILGTITTWFIIVIIIIGREGSTTSSVNASGVRQRFVDVSNNSGDNHGDHSSIRHNNNTKYRGHRALQQGLVLTGLDLIHAATDSKITTLTNGQIIVVSSIPGMNINKPTFNIEARSNTKGVIKSVIFGYQSNANFRLEKFPRWAFCGNRRNDFFDCNVLRIGTHRITATPYSGRNGSGNKGPTIALNFTVVANAITTPTTRAAPKAPSPITPAPNSLAPKSPDFIAPAPKSPDIVTLAPKTPAPIPPAPKTPAPTSLAPKSPDMTNPAPKTPATITQAPKSLVPKSPDSINPAPKTPATITPAPKTLAPTPPNVINPAPKTSATITPAPKTLAPKSLAPKSPDIITPAPKSSAPKSPAPKLPAPKSPAPITLAPKNPAPTIQAPKSAAPIKPAPVTLAPKSSPAPKSPAPIAPAPISPEPKSPAAPIPSPPATGITRLELVYTGNSPHVGARNLTLFAINEIDIGTLLGGIPFAQFSVNAVRTGTTVNSVRFNTGWSESGVPYAYCGNSGPIYTTCSDLAVGAYVNVTVTPYPQSSQQGPPFPIVWAVVNITDSRNGTSPPTPNVPMLVGSTGNWLVDNPYPLLVSEVQGGIMGDTFFLVSGFREGYSENSTTTLNYARNVADPNSQWVRLDDHPVWPGVTHGGFVVVGTKFYICGGYVGGGRGPTTDRCFVFEPFKPPGSQWTSFASLPDRGRSGGGLVYDTQMRALIFAGGAVRAKPLDAIDYTNTWMYFLDNPGAGWVPKAPIPYVGNHIGFVTAFDGSGTERHFFLGGQMSEEEDEGNTAAHYEYVAANNTWIQRKSIPYPRGHISSSTRALYRGFIMVGGCTNGGMKVSDITYYDIDADQWTKIGNIPTPRNTPVCDIHRPTNVMYCESGTAFATSSYKRGITLP